MFMIDSTLSGHNRKRQGRDHRNWKEREIQLLVGVCWFIAETLA